MARDRREEIITKVESLLATVSGIVAVHRDRFSVKDTDLPAAVILDGREEIRTELRGHSLVPMTPAMVTLYPQIWVLLKPRDTDTNLTLAGVSAPIGPEISTYRTRVLKAIITDSDLAASLGANGQIEYTGCDTDMQSGSSMAGQVQLHFAFTYFLNPAEL